MVKDCCTRAAALYVVPLFVPPDWSAFTLHEPTALKCTIPPLMEQFAEVEASIVSVTARPDEAVALGW